MAGDVSDYLHSGRRSQLRWDDVRGYVVTRLTDRKQAEVPAALAEDAMRVLARRDRDRRLVALVP